MTPKKFEGTVSVCEKVGECSHHIETMIMDFDAKILTTSDEWLEQHDNLTLEKNYNLWRVGLVKDRLARHWIPEKPTIAVYRPPIKYRSEFKFSENGYEQWFQFLPMQPRRNPCGIDCEDFYRNYLINESNSDINYYRNLDAILTLTC